MCSVFSGEKEAFWFNKAPKSLNFFVPKCNVKTNTCMEEKVRYMESKVMVSILYIGFNCMFVFVSMYFFQASMIISLRCSM